MRIEQLKEVVTTHRKWVDIDSRVQLEDMILLVQSLLEKEKEDLQENEPYAIVSIRQLAKAIQGVQDLYHIIEDMETEDIVKAGIFH